MRFFFILFLFSHLNVLSQKKDYPKNFFRSPVDYKYTLAGNFGELRNNHFHSGLDIRTNGEEGKKIYAVADGYVSRIKTSATGYGKVIYITHPNGYVSVYAHLQQYIGEIAKYMREAQNRAESFEMELFPEPNKLTVKKGEIIALSGNSGGSAGPHLHFEIRDAITEYPINPAFFGLGIPDNKAPVIQTFFVYPMDDSSFVNGKNFPISFPVIKLGNYYKIKSPAGLKLQGNIGFGFKSVDYANESMNTLGVYGAELKIDTQLCFSFEIDEFSFLDTRYMNSHIDYYRSFKGLGKITKCFVDEGNQLKIYQKNNKNGIYFFEPEKMYKITLSNYDVDKNKSELIIEAKGEGSNKKLFKLKESYQSEFKANQVNEWMDDGLKIVFPQNCFYQNFNFKYQRKNNPGNYYSDIFEIHDPSIPIHTNYELEIKNSEIPNELHKKVIVARVSGSKIIESMGGIYSEGMIKVKPKTFGSFAIAVDTISPVITPLNITKTNSVKGKGKLIFKITDNLAGIETYKLYLNEKWVLLEHDAKSRTFTYLFDENLKSGKNKLKLVVSDRCGNTKLFEKTILN